ncbi:MAG: alanine racemase, partial [Gammaproteobacteria bacterium]|nr:alanine racemase [Gammaproteobacteria bacterium]
MIARTQAEFDLTALRHNFSHLKTLIQPQCKVLSMIKSDAYGHGALKVAEQLSRSDAFGVACLTEGLALRRAGINKPIVVMSGVNNTAELNIAEENQFELVVHQAEQVDLLESHLTDNINIWLKIDTGMHRLGIAPVQAIGLLQRLEANKKIQSPVTLMTHLADAENHDLAFTKQQLKSFFTLLENQSCPASIANSATIFNIPNAHVDWVRPGIMLYGVSPFAEKTGRDLNLKPVMTLRSKLIAINQLKKGAKVGYSGTWTCPEDMLVGVIAIGYGDGYPRHAQNGTPILINGTLCPLVGRVSMDLITVDLRDCMQAKTGDAVTLWG